MLMFTLFGVNVLLKGCKRNLLYETKLGEILIHSVRCQVRTRLGKVRAA